MDYWSHNLNADFALKYCLFRAVKLSKNANLDKNKMLCCGYVIGFNSCWIFSIQNFDWSRFVILFDVVNSSLPHIGNRKKDISILNEKQTQKSDDTTITAEAKYPTNTTNIRNKLFLVCIIIEARRFLYAYSVKTHRLKAKESEIKSYTLCLDNISKDLTIDNMKKLD